MNKTNYIVFEHILDPGRDKPVSVNADLFLAEEDRMSRQRDRANNYNTERRKAFFEGRAVGRKKTAYDYIANYSIVEVQQA